MKRSLTVLLALLLLLPCGALAQEGVITFDDQLVVTFYRAVPTPEGGVVLSLNLRNKENNSPEENPSLARLVCLSAQGDILWDQVEDKGNTNIYGDISTDGEGNLLVLYHHYQEAADLDEWELRRFSPGGELLEAVPVEQLLPQGHTSVSFVPFSGGMIINSLRVEGEDWSNPECAYTVLDMQLQTLWQTFAAKKERDWAYEAGPCGDGLMLFNRLFDRDALALSWVDGQGQPAWQMELKEGEGRWLCQVTPGGDAFFCTLAWDPSGQKMAAPATLLRVGADGQVKSQVELQLPQTSDRQVMAADWLVTEDSLLLLCRAKTDTCLRLLRFDLGGRLTGSVDWSSGNEDDTFLGTDLLLLGGRTYACSSVENGSSRRVVLVPMTLEEAK